MLNIVLFGPPGAGKGTQAAMLKDHYGLEHISTGDVFRANIKGETELGKLAKSFIDKGNLVPDEVTINMLDDEMNQRGETKGFIFDGFPRTTDQATALDALMAKRNSHINLMLSLEVEEDELRKRLAARAKDSGRPDDADPKVIQNRIDVYNKETAPVKEFYAAQEKLEGIDGIGTIEEVTKRLYKAVEAHVG